MAWTYLLLAMASLGASGPMANGKPEVTYVGMAAPDVVVVTIAAQAVEHGKQVPYETQPGDKIVNWRQHRYVRRGEVRIGSLVGSEGKILCTPDRLVGDPLDTVVTDQAESYRIAAAGDEQGVRPQAVFRKSKPVDCTRAPARETSAMEHTVFLKLADSLATGRRYTIHFRPGLLAEESVSFDFEPSRLRSEAIHVQQIGFRPDDPGKLAFLSCWMGNGGGLPYPAGLTFQVLDDRTGEAVYSAQATLGKTALDPTNKTAADIHELDFSSCKRPGVYRVCVGGVGCSFPFEIGPDVWRRAFVKSMRGLYCQRSGIALGPPHTDFVRPRGFHPADGVKVYVSEPRVAGEDESLRRLPAGLQALVDSFDPDHDRFRQWLGGLTNRTLPDAWGGYMDAGDWDRRADHALMPLMMFDLAEMAPEAFAEWKFNIPDSQDELPDLINEALWKVDFLKRMQQADGSVYAAIESGAHPRRGEASWQESLPVFAYARTRSAAYNYAAVAARAAGWFQMHSDRQQTQEYRESALRAMEWAERQPEPLAAGPADRQAARRDTRADARCLAAAELYRLTADTAWHEVFLRTTRFHDPRAPFLTSHLGHISDPQGVAAWTYLRIAHASVDKVVQANIRTALLRDADRDARLTEATDFHWAGGPGRAISWGALSKPESNALVRAHFLTGEERYLRAIVLSTLSGAGANPANMCYVTGVGTRWPQHPLHEDAYVSNQPLYEGVTIGGPIDPRSRNKHPTAARFEKMLYPPAAQWPATESYFDVFGYVPMNEFTVHQTMLPTSFVWGYLAARKNGSGSE
jgi:endoglucanase